MRPASVSRFVGHATVLIDWCKRCSSRDPRLVLTADPPIRNGLYLIGGAHAFLEMVEDLGEGYRLGLGLAPGFELH